PSEHGATSWARALLEQRLVIPVLDGFDELPKSSRRLAIRQINAALRSGDPLVLASRTAEYRAVAGGDLSRPVRVLAAATVELRDLDPTVVAAYLRQGAGTAVAARRWDPVVDLLAGSSPVAQALRTPLMVDLAQIIHNGQLDESDSVDSPLPD